MLYGDITVYSVVLNPGAVNPATSTLTTVAVAGLLLANSVILHVRKPAIVTGLVVGDARPSADGVLQVQLVNVTAATITPSTTEAYLVFEAKDATSRQSGNAIAAGDNL